VRKEHTRKYPRDNQQPLLPANFPPLANIALSDTQGPSRSLNALLGPSSFDQVVRNLNLNAVDNSTLDPDGPPPLDDDQQPSPNGDDMPVTPPLYTPDNLSPPASPVLHPTNTHIHGPIDETLAPLLKLDLESDEEDLYDPPRAVEEHPIG